MAVTDQTVLDIEMIGTDIDDWNAASTIVARVTASYSTTPTMPVLMTEN